MWNLVVLTTILGAGLGPVGPDSLGPTGQGEARAAAQDPAKPADDQNKADEAKLQDPGESAEETEAKPERVPPFAITLGWMDWNLDGSQSKFRQYATPARGLFARELLFAPLPSTHDGGYLSLRSPGETDYRHDGRLNYFHGQAQLEFGLWRNEFLDPAPFILAASRRKNEEGAVKLFLGPEIAISSRYSMSTQDQFFQPPLDPLHQRTRYWDAILAGKLGNGQVHLGYSDWRYFDRTIVRPDAAVSGFRLGYMWTPGDMGLEANLSDLEVTQSGHPTGHVRMLSFSGDAPVGSSTDVGVLLRHDRLSVPTTVTAYSREQRIGQVSLGHRWGKWNTRFSLSQRDIARVRGDQSFVDVPQWVTFEGRLDGRLTRNLRLTARGYTQQLSQIPPMVTDDPRSLYWNARDFVQLRLQHSNGENGAYFVWSYRNWDNQARAVNLNLNSFVVGGNWQISDRLGLFAEFTQDLWKGRSEVTALPTLQMFLPDSYVISAGLDWMVNSRAFLSMHVTNFATDNDNPLLLRDGNTNGLFLSINARYLLNGGNEVGLTIAPWTYRDDVSSVMNYDAAVVMLSGKLRF